MVPLALGSPPLGLVGLISELDRPQPQLLLHLGLGCDLCEIAAPPLQFAEIACIRHRYLPDRSYSWIPEEGDLVPAKLGSASQKAGVRDLRGVPGDDGKVGKVERNEPGARGFTLAAIAHELNERFGLPLPSGCKVH